MADYRFLALEKHDDLTVVYSLEDGKLYYFRAENERHEYTRILGTFAKQLKDKHRARIEEAKGSPKFTSHHGV